MSTKHTEWIVRLAVGMALIFGGTTPSNAQMILIDDFNDGNDSGWTRTDWLSGQSGIFDASSGAYNMRSTQPITGGVGALFSLWNNSRDPQFSDGFLRAKVKVNTAGSLAWLYMRGAENAPTSYVFVAKAGEPYFQIQRASDDNLTFPMDDPTLDFGVGEEWYIEGGAVGDRLTMKVWQVGDPEPTAPQLRVTDSTFSRGNFGVGGNVPTSRQPDFLDITFDDIYFTPIPEPSAFMLLIWSVVGIAWAVLHRQRVV